MYLIRYEKDSLKDYIVYDVSNNQLPNIIQCDNGFQQVHLNEDSINLRLYLKIIIYNTTVHHCIEHLHIFLNNTFGTRSEDWTVCINEKYIAGNTRLSFLCYSHKYFMKLYWLKNLVSELHDSHFIFDDTIYYRKYHNFIISELPNQSNYAKRFHDTYKTLYGNPNNVLLELLDNLTEFQGWPISIY